MHFLAVHEGSDKPGVASRFDEMLDLGCRPQTLFCVSPPADPVLMSAGTGLDPFVIHCLHIFKGFKGEWRELLYHSVCLICCDNLDMKPTVSPAIVGL